MVSSEAALDTRKAALTGAACAAHQVEAGEGQQRRQQARQQGNQSPAHAEGHHVRDPESQVGQGAQDHRAAQVAQDGIRFVVQEADFRGGTGKFAAQGRDEGSAGIVRHGWVWRGVAEKEAGL
jgi:hypothetical protein